MADGSDDLLSARAESNEALAAQIALGQESGSEAREYLKKQSRIADLAIDTLQKKDEFELSHLRFRRFSDYARFALEISIGLVVLLIVCGLATMVWNASRDNGLVVDAFSVPQDVAQSGMTGSVLAGRILDRFGHMQAVTSATTQAASAYHADTADAVRVEIPDTGISLGELNRYLRAWLGHETHVTGDLVHVPGGFALTTRYGAEPGSTVEGKADKLNALIEKSAEQIYAAALPYRYVEYLAHQQRFAEALALAPTLAASGTPQNRALAYSAWANAYFYQGDIRQALEKGREAVRLDPDNPIPHAWQAVAEANLGHEEASRANLVAALQHPDQIAALVAPQMASWVVYKLSAYADEATDDSADAVRQWMKAAKIRPLGNSDAQNASEDAGKDHDLFVARQIASTMRDRDRLGRPDPQKPLTAFFLAYAAQDWKQAARLGNAADSIYRTQPDQKWGGMLMWPVWAEAMARSGDFKAADELIAKTARDCDDCLRKRGRIAALEGRFKDAAQDFAMVGARSPHEPDAETDWGEMLLRHGDLDGAIAKFTLANQKGPHFADPLEMWGEALIDKNRSDLALAKFEEANKYAPNWGRLHLKWGEALLWSGDHAGARKQFTAAAHLDLTPSETSELARVNRHG